jgi:ABC-type sugar transport system permease subunit
MKSTTTATPVDVRADVRSRRRRLPREWLVGYLFVAPAVLLFLLVGLYTVVYSFVLSFFSWDGISPQFTSWVWVGLANFQSFLTSGTDNSSVFYTALEHTLVLCLIVPITSCLIGLALALLLNRSGILASIFRTVYFLPVVSTGVATLYTWQLMYQPGGIISSLLNAVHLQALVPYNGLLGTPDFALPAVMVVMIWSTAPTAMILYLAGLQTIPHEVLAAAEMDGATTWQKMRLIIWPLLLPVTGLLMILFLNQVIQDYQTVFLLTNGGPANATNVVGLMVFGHATQLGGMSGGLSGNGVGSAQGWALALFTAVIALVQLRLFRSRT